MLLLLLACQPKLVAPAFVAASPVWPPAPDEPRVAYVGEVTAPAPGFQRPVGVACGPGHRLAVADIDAACVWSLDLDSRRWFRVGASARLSLRSPVGVDFGPDGSLFIVDSSLAGVYRTRGDKKRRLQPVQVGPPLSRPVGILVRDDGSLVVVDAGTHALQEILPDGSIRQLTAGRGSGGEGLNFPVDVDSDDSGALYVSDSMNSIVQKLAGSQLAVVAGGVGYGGGRLARPKGIAVDKQQRVHVVDAAMQHVQVYDHQGTLLGRYGGPGSGPGELSLPAGICADDDQHIFVADSLNHRIQVYELL